MKCDVDIRKDLYAKIEPAVTACPRAPRSPARCCPRIECPGLVSPHRERGRGRAGTMAPSQPVRNTFHGVLPSAANTKSACPTRPAQLAAASAPGPCSAVRRAVSPRHVRHEPARARATARAPLGIYSFPASASATSSPTSAPTGLPGFCQPRRPSRRRSLQRPNGPDQHRQQAREDAVLHCNRDAHCRRGGPSTRATPTCFSTAPPSPSPPRCAVARHCGGGRPKSPSVRRRCAVARHCGGGRPKSPSVRRRCAVARHCGGGRPKSPSVRRRCAVARHCGGERPKSPSGGRPKIPRTL
jgi:hypothetical protein